MAATRVPRRRTPPPRPAAARNAAKGNPVSRFFDHFAAHVTRWADRRWHSGWR